MLQRKLTRPRRVGLLVAAGAVLTFCLFATVASSRPDDDASVITAVHSLLGRYASHDSAGVIALLDPQGFVVYGSDAAEKVETIPALVELMNADFRLWHTAAFGEIQDVSTVVDGSLATAYFQVPFSAGGRPPVLVRFSTTWRKVNGAWRLRQSANTVPTVGMAASTLAR